MILFFENKGKPAVILVTTDGQAYIDGEDLHEKNDRITVKRKLHSTKLEKNERPYIVDCYNHCMNGTDVFDQQLHAYFMFTPFRNDRWFGQMVQMVKDLEIQNAYLCHRSESSRPLDRNDFYCAIAFHWLSDPVEEENPPGRRPLPPPSPPTCSTKRQNPDPPVSTRPKK